MAGKAANVAGARATAVRGLEAVAAQPALAKAWVHPAGPGLGRLVTVESSQLNFRADKRRRILRRMLLPDGGPERQLHPLGPPQELAEPGVWSPSPHGDRLLVARTEEKGGAAGAASSTAWELWENDRLVWEFLGPPRVHGPVLGGGTFSRGMVWDASLRYVAFVAETAPPEPPKFGRKRPEAGEAGAAEEEHELWNGRGDWTDDWGERNTGMRSPGVYVLDLEEQRVAGVPGLPAGCSVGQPVWISDGAGGRELVVTVWPEKSPTFAVPQKLGLVYCFNRPSSLYKTAPLPASGALADWAAGAGEATNLTAAIRSAHSAVAYNGGSLVFLSHETAVETGVHKSCASLMSVSGDGTLGTVCPAVDVPDESGFCGLYCPTIPHDAVHDGRLVLQTFRRSNEELVSIDLRAGPKFGDVTSLTPTSDAQPKSYQYLGQGLGILVASESSPVDPPRLVWARLDAAVPSGQLKWEPTTCYEEPAVKKVISDLTYRCVQLPRDDTTIDVMVLNNKDFNDVKLPGKSPAVLVPHGGPHSVYPACWIFSNALLCSLGYTVIVVNYRGSTGFGSRDLTSLPGKAGDQDVRDCVAALDMLVEEGTVDPDRVGIQGGSHGGFLTAHLLGQFPDRFRTGVLRNPVCNMATMVGITDIPDWCFVEAYGCGVGVEKCKPAPTPEDLHVLFSKSPMAHVENVKAPTLFLLGQKDRRTPSPDALQYINALKQGGREVRTLMFPEDNHVSVHDCSSRTGTGAGAD